jgi:hypothetical protein
MRVVKKTWPELFQDVLDGKKKFDLRLADFDINIGDILVLKEWDPETNEFTGREIEKEVKYLLKTKGLNFNTQEEIEKFGFQVIQFE